MLNWLPVFTRPGTVQIILDALAWRQQHQEVRVYGYVILENHLHCILQAPDLGRQVHNFKAFTAKEIIRYLRANHAHKLLELLAVFKKTHKTDSQHQFWQEGSHPQLLQDEVMLRQKLDYIHLNPVQRGYVEDATHWRYSSARNYQGQEGLIPVWMDW